jgi:hypothetical protein
MYLFRVKNHDFTSTNHIFSNFRVGARAGCALPLDPPLGHQSLNIGLLSTRTLAFFFYRFVMVVRKNVLEYIIALVVVKNKVRLKKCSLFFIIWKYFGKWCETKYLMCNDFS